MTKEEYFNEYTRLKAEIERNEKIHCHLVANKHRRYLDKLVKRWNEQTGGMENGKQYDD